MPRLLLRESSAVTVFPQACVARARASGNVSGLVGNALAPRDAQALAPLP